MNAQYLKIHIYCGFNDCDRKTIFGFERYTNLKILVLRSFNHDLSPLFGIKLQRILIPCYTGSLLPLANSDIIEINANMFDGDVSPLIDKPIQIICMNNFTGKIGWFVKSKTIQYVEMAKIPYEVLRYTFPDAKIIKKSGNGIGATGFHGLRAIGFIGCIEPDKITDVPGTDTVPIKEMGIMETIGTVG